GGVEVCASVVVGVVGQRIRRGRGITGKRRGKPFAEGQRPDRLVGRARRQKGQDEESPRQTNDRKPRKTHEKRITQPLGRTALDAGTILEALPFEARVWADKGEGNMKRWTGMIALLAFFAAGAVIAQTASESVTKQKSSQGTTKMKAKTVTGTVKEYEAGRKIKITGPGNRNYSFDLDENARVEGNVAVGETAKVEYTRDSAGKDHVTVLSEARAASTAPPASMAQAAESHAAQGGTMHMESTSKQTGPGPNTK